MEAQAQSTKIKAAPIWRQFAVWGPGLLVMLADTDAGNVVTAAQSGVQWGYRLLPLVLILVPMLYMVQELTVRLGIHTQRGHGSSHEVGDTALRDVPDRSDQEAHPQGQEVRSRERQLRRSRLLIISL